MDIDSLFKRIWEQIYLKIKFVAMFDSHIKYGSVIWGQIINRTNIFFLLQKEAIRTINFKERRAHTSPLFQNSNILKLLDRIKISKFYQSATMYTINYFVSLISGLIFHQTSISIKPPLTQRATLRLQLKKSTSRGKAVIISMLIEIWNDIQKIPKDVLFNSFSRTKLKLFVNKFLSGLFKDLQ